MVIAAVSQCDRILDYLRAGNTLTPYRALVEFGTLALHSRIAELRERGHAIECRLIEHAGKRVGEYSLRQS